MISSIHSMVKTLHLEWGELTFANYNDIRIEVHYRTINPEGGTVITNTDIEVNEIIVQEDVIFFCENQGFEQIQLAVPRYNSVGPMISREDALKIRDHIYSDLYEGRG